MNRPTLSLSCSSPVQNSPVQQSKDSQTPRIPSWGSSQFSGSNYGDMEGLPSPMIEMEAKSGWNFRDSLGNGRRQSSEGSREAGSHSYGKNKNKTSSFFDSDGSIAVAPPPNPISRSSSLRVVSNASESSSWGRRSEGSGSSSSWLERVDDPDRPPIISGRLVDSLLDSKATATPLPAISTHNLPTSPTSALFSSTTSPSKDISTFYQPLQSLPTAVDPPTRGARFLNFTKKIVGGSQPDQLSPPAFNPPSPIRSEPSPIDQLPGGLSEDDFETDSATKPGELVGQFVVVKLLGKGAFSRVALASRKGKEREEEGIVGELVALKMITKRSYEGNERMRISVVREVEVLKHIHHRSLISLTSSFSTPSHTVLVLDYAPGGELFDFLADWHQEMTEELARRMFGELCGVVGWMHSIGLVHRDIKLENILLTSRPFPSSDSSSLLQSLPTPFLKLTDFGLSRFINPASPLLSTRCGSEAYAAPELIMGKKYDGRSTDAWAVGVVLFALITGEMPFIELDSRRTYLMKIAKGEYAWPKEKSSVDNSGQLVSPISPEGSHPTTTDSPMNTATRLATPALKSLVGSLLVRDPEKRLKVDDVWNSEWMNGIGRPEKVLGWVSERDEVESFAKEVEL